MPEIDSTQDQPPFFGPQFPVHPWRDEVVRIPQGTMPLSGNVYSAFIQQFTPPLGLRDRIQVYLQEPNGTFLNAGYYSDVRLVGVYNSLPLYVVTCCPTGGSSSSSVPGH